MKRAVLSAADKTGIVALARALRDSGWEIVSSGGTARYLEGEGIQVIQVSQVTGFPEILDGRVTTLHPKLHGGILALRDKPEHMEQLETHRVTPVDMVVCNLYPFVEAARRPGATLEEVIEQIDIGGPSLIRAAAKNYRWVTVVCNPDRYPLIIDEIRAHGEVGPDLRLKLAYEAFAHTARYDAAISSYFASLQEDSQAQDTFPDHLVLGYHKVLSLRYGENPHQRAGYYEPVLGGHIPSLKGAQIQGKPLSYNNINDLDNAFHAVWDLSQAGCVIVKHAAPCGAAVARTPREAFDAAFQGDPVSAFGGIVAFNCEVDKDCAEAMKDIFLEVVAAPSFTEDALETLKAKKNLRLLTLAPVCSGNGQSGCGGDAGANRPALGGGHALKTAMGGILVQEKDKLLPGHEEWRVVSKRQPTDEEVRTLQFAMTVCKHVKSNAIVLARGLQTVGIGGGQPNRVDAVRIAVKRAGDRARDACLASDAFFPFPDAVSEAAEAGVTAIAHPGGSIRDQESICVADRHGIAMVLTGHRHFLH
ncbi:MAG: bifunctional phosphoribosylaminoimidazolecarboxamide formyltransferase/IMP cyclohydrolase [Firmicutes bacterium]|nr:bifunctional phosphoribosylaminoimidazolecarboxamide formyltransferase/IMP cyclohydrolase [Candidatus Fermentithermobacillaceae bacterium]